MRLNVIKGALVALVLFALLVGLASAAPADTSQSADQALQQGLQGSSGGSFGYYLKQVGGAALLQRNDSLAYDPASALKTLILAYALHQVASGADSLSNLVTVYNYPNSRNANGNPANPDLCPDPADEVPANASSIDLQSVLSGMMQVSNNRYTRALELRYGRGNLSAYAASLGMSSTRFDQIFGCGWDGGLRNNWTLDDAGRLYEAIVTGSAGSASVRDQLMSDMPILQVSYTSVAQQEASSLGIPGATVPFGNSTIAYYKDGAYDICVGACSSSTYIIRDTAGILVLPFQTAKGVVPTDFVWGSFIANVLASCSSFPCQAGDRAEAAVKSSLTEIFRPAIHAALQTWTSLTVLSARAAVWMPKGLLKVSAYLATRYGMKHPAGQVIRFAIKGRVICQAKSSVSGFASCTSRPPKGATVYTAKFSGTSTLFGATAAGRIPKQPKVSKK